eukprot:7871008-Alexandrium_andersonii.AAC.1
MFTDLRHVKRTLGISGSTYPQLFPSLAKHNIGKYHAATCGPYSLSWNRSMARCYARSWIC